MKRQRTPESPGGITSPAAAGTRRAEGRIRLRVRYGETDCMGRAHHANYLSYFEAGRIELMRDIGFDYARVEREDGCFLPVYRAQLRYRAPAGFDDELEVVTRIVDFSFVRVTFHYEVRRTADGTLCVEGKTVLASVDRAGQPRRLPRRLEAYLEGLDLPPERERRAGE
ncbi:MAG: acyl-CoA thioesterase [Planctomycetota bacterium]